VKFLQTEGKQASRLKYPVYDLEPEGPFIHKYLRDADFREKNELTTEALQKKYADNRRRYEAKLMERLRSGEWLVSEDYIGTGIAWGLAWGAQLEYLEEINRGLYQPDFCILIHGDRFRTAIEADHRNEMTDEKIWICRNFYYLLADRYGWKKVNGNQDIEAVSRDILAVLKSVI
jgi:thymidylate kinase